ncbi:large subunit GTPase 1-like protein [Pyrus ussuriensis x Pyrus communis]|uniref:Large subunit GTPase 1-like protein n=1 Tax=Pyrus ussuriensis x Pyrus communis TaxID=2448454 RepID=A0A5N5H1I2_9ROSA|nr:large subunit GTPase 1-like protein [Pyrus ussuriensis x Pyrus communis]
MLNPILGQAMKDHCDADCLSASSNVVMGFVGYPNVGNSLFKQHKSYSSKNEHSIDDEGEDEPKVDHVLEDFNSFDLANGLVTKKKVTVRKPTTPHKQHKNYETPLQNNSNVEIHTAYDCQSGFLSYFIVSEDEMCLDDAEKQVLECIDKESANS